MNKSWFCLAPLVLIIAFVFCGCTNESSSGKDVKLGFACDSEIVMKYGTINDEPAYAKLITDVDTKTLKVNYNKDIINYDIISGKITPLSDGRTVLTVKSGKNSASVKINVISAKYCTNLDLAKKYVVKLNDAKCSAIVPFTNKSYNMGFTFKSMDTNVIDVDSNGVITPKSKGTAMVSVSAINGVKSSNYTTVSKMAAVIVEDEASTLNLEILNSDLEPLSIVKNSQGFDYYELYSNKTLYVLKYNSDISLKNRLMSSSTNLVDNYLGNTRHLYDFNVGNAGYNIPSFSKDGKTLYRPFYAVDCGEDYIQESLIDAAMNSNNVVPSNLLKIKVFQGTDTFKIDVFYDKNLENQVFDKREIINLNLKNEIAEIYIKVKVNNFANKDFFISKSGDFLLEKLENQVFKVTFTAVGNEWLYLGPKDNVDLLTKLEFSICKPQYQSEMYLSKSKVSLCVNDFTTIDFNLYDENGNIISNHNGVSCDVYKDGETLDNSAFDIRFSYNNFYVKALKTGNFVFLLQNDYTGFLNYVSVYVV